MRYALSFLLSFILLGGTRPTLKVSPLTSFEPVKVHAEIRIPPDTIAVCLEWQDQEQDEPNKDCYEGIVPRLMTYEPTLWAGDYVFTGLVASEDKQWHETNTVQVRVESRIGQN